MRREVTLSVGLLSMVCADVRIDQVQYLGCLNEMFRAAVKPGAITLVPNPAAAPAPAVGTYNQAAVREMLGKSFGHSVVPWRPPSPRPANFPR
jgi:hypothetical protein